jgi:glycerol-3-phosphate acyltransferase PlsY
MQWSQNLSADWTQVGWTALAAYLLGCFSTGYYLVRSRAGKDLRLLGSGSLGARNVGRELGWWGFLITLAGDMGKGALAVWAARRFGTGTGLTGIALVAVLAGHIWPVQLRLQGGKGVATLLGALIIYDFRLAVAWALVFSGPFLVTRRTTLAAMLGFAMLPFPAMWLARHEPVPAALAQTLVIILGSSMVLFAHRKNLGQELDWILAHRTIRPKH